MTNNMGRSCAVASNTKKVRVLSLPGRNYQHNPYFGLFCDSLEIVGAQVISNHSFEAKTFRFDVLHMHFPEHYIQEKALWEAVFLGAMFLTYVAAARLLGKKIVWTIHEAIPTKRHLWLAGLYLACVRRLVNGYVFMNNTTQNAFLTRNPTASRQKICRIRHCPYDVEILSAHRREEIRRSLVADPHCILVGYLGEIRDYKQPGLLPALPRQHPDGRPIKIVAAGALNAATNAEKVEEAFLATGKDRLMRINHRLSDQELSELIQTVDVVFLPYAYGWNSGFAMLTLSCRTPLIASDIPMFREIFDDLGSPWIQLFNTGIKDAIKELHDAVTHVIDLRRDEFDECPLESYLKLCNHNQSAETLMDFYGSLWQGTQIRSDGRAAVGN